MTLSTENLFPVVGPPRRSLGHGLAGPGLALPPEPIVPARIIVSTFYVPPEGRTSFESVGHSWRCNPKAHNPSRADKRLMIHHAPGRWTRNT